MNTLTRLAFIFLLLATACSDDDKGNATPSIRGAYDEEMLNLQSSFPLIQEKVSENALTVEELEYVKNNLISMWALLPAEGFTESAEEPMPLVSTPLQNGYMVFKHSLSLPKDRPVNIHDIRIEMVACCQTEPKKIDYVFGIRISDEMTHPIVEDSKAVDLKSSNVINIKELNYSTFNGSAFEGRLVFKSSDPAETSSGYADVLVSYSSYPPELAEKLAHFRSEINAALAMIVQMQENLKKGQSNSANYLVLDEIQRRIEKAYAELP